MESPERGEIHNRNFRLIGVLDSARRYAHSTNSRDNTNSCGSRENGAWNDSARLNLAICFVQISDSAFDPLWIAINEEAAIKKIVIVRVSQRDCLHVINIYSLAFLVLEFIFRELATNLLAARDRREICRPFRRRGEILRREENR